MKLTIIGWCLWFQFHYYAKCLTHAKIAAYTFLNIREKIHQFCQVLKEMHTKENWFLFFRLTV